MGARDDKITECAGSKLAAARPASVNCLSVCPTYGSPRPPISAGVIHICVPPQSAATTVLGVPPFTTSHTSAIVAFRHPAFTASSQFPPEVFHFPYLEPPFQQ